MSAGLACQAVRLGDAVDGLGFADRVEAQVEGLPVDAERLEHAREVEAGHV